MTTQLRGPAAERALPTPEPPNKPEKSESVVGRLTKIVLLGLATAIAVWAAFPLMVERPSAETGGGPSGCLSGTAGISPSTR